MFVTDIFNKVIICVLKINVGTMNKCEMNKMLPFVVVSIKTGNIFAIDFFGVTFWCKRIIFMYCVMFWNISRNLKLKFSNGN